jgi:DNA-binding transcriptional MerR regulator
MSPTAEPGPTAAATTPAANSEAATAEIPHREIAGQGQTPAGGELLGIGAAAARTGVSERALRYYQQIGLLVPACTTPGGLRRYSADDLARVARIRKLQTLLGLNLDEIAVELRNEDRIAQIRLSYHDERTSDAERQQLTRESLALAEDLRATVQAKRNALDSFLADLDTRISRTRALLAGTGPVTSPSSSASDG